jgi:hypothetical protein
MKRLLCLVALSLALLLPSRAFAAAKTYQVTGKVLEVTDKMIAVEKGKDRWEIDRDADTKVDGDLKVGEKVTITYHMTANKIEAKEGSGDKKEAKSASDK